MLLACFRKVFNIDSRTHLIYCKLIKHPLIAIICRAMCISPIELKAICPMVPLQVMSKSPVTEIVTGFSVHRFICNFSLERLLAPVRYGIPIWLSLYSLGSKSLPDNNCITFESLHHLQLPGISYGINSVISVQLEPICS